MGWRERFPPLCRAADMLGPVLPDIASRIGLESGTPVACGVHDSNASLLAHLAARKPPFAVVSTGTWVVSMAVGGRKIALDPTRDTLVNVNAFGDPVPSARFMGGREFETIVPETGFRAGYAEWRTVLSEPVMLLPSVQQGSGPYSTSTATWAGREPAAGERFLAASFYLALMTATCLNLIGAEGDIVVEGPFAGSEAYLAMLSVAAGRSVFSQGAQSTGTSLGAALLAGTLSGSRSDNAFQTARDVSAMQSYARQWFALTAAVPMH
jgi:sugar (pentulose or hexulose) kinase